MLPRILMDQDIRQWLEEDIPYWDWTSLPLWQEEEIVSARIIAKQKGIIAGIKVCSRIFELLGITTSILHPDKSSVKQGQKILELNGRVAGIVRGERTALNILSHMSGIATQTHKIVDRIKQGGFETVIAATRKTLPGLRKYQKWAVRIGGGDTHRLNLSDMVLIKENHLRKFGNMEKTITTIRRSTSFSQKIEIEVTTERDALEAIQYKIDVLMLDNFSSQQVKTILPQLRVVNPDVLIEVSGNITELNLMDYVRTGVDIISMGKLTHSVSAFDLSLLID